MHENLEQRVKNSGAKNFRSEGERKIAEFLNNYGINYVYEPGVLVTDRDKPKIWYPDFYLPEFAAYIEYYGFVGNQNYDHGIERKKKVYSAMGLEVIAVYPWTFCENWQKYIVNNLYEISRNRLDILLKKTYRAHLPRQNKRNSYSPGSTSRFGVLNYRR